MLKLPFGFFGETEAIHLLINKHEFENFMNPFTIEHIFTIEYLFDVAKKEENVLFKASDKLNQLFCELENVKPKKDKTEDLLYKVKVFEILLELYESDVHDEKSKQRTYTDAQIRVVNKIKNDLSRDIASYVSLEVLSSSYGINLTTLKNCFRDMYGKPLYTWYREYKFYRARELIKNTHYPISRIADMVGYKSSSKFAKAFKKEMGVLPSSYRKKR